MTIPYLADPQTKVFGATPRTLTSGTSIVLDARGMTTLTVVTPAGVTATVSRVDSLSAVADSTDTAANVTVPAATKQIITVDWSFFRVTANGGTVRVTLMG